MKMRRWRRRRGEGGRAGGRERASGEQSVSGGKRRGSAGALVTRGVGVAAPLAMSAPPTWSRGAGAGLYPLFSCREVPMNFATLNKKWFHEVNISVTIPSPTRGAHARTHSRTYVHNAYNTQRRLRRDDDDDDTTTTPAAGRVYIHTRARAHTCLRASRTRVRTHTGAYSVYTRAVSLAPASAFSLPLPHGFLLFFAHRVRSSAYITGLRTHTRGFAQAGGTRSC